MPEPSPEMVELRALREDVQEIKIHVSNLDQAGGYAQAEITRLQGRQEKIEERLVKLEFGAQIQKWLGGILSVVLGAVLVNMLSGLSIQLNGGG
ncbi:MAG: hypothetical protein AAF512_12550 [Pseudomonadota bacterium]